MGIVWNIVCLNWIVEYLLLEFDFYWSCYGVILFFLSDGLVDDDDDDEVCYGDGDDDGDDVYVYDVFLFFEFLLLYC